MRPMRLAVAALLLLLLLALSSVRGIVTPDAPSDPTPSASADASSGDSTASEAAEPTQNEGPTGDAHSVDADAASSPQRIAEPDEPKADTELADEDVDPLLDVPSGLFEVVDADSVDNRKRQNYASLDAGATILDAAPDTKSPTNLLVPDKDRYMLTPCSNPRKWVVISLSEDVSQGDTRYALHNCQRGKGWTDAVLTGLVLIGRCTQTRLPSPTTRSSRRQSRTLSCWAASTTPRTRGSCSATLRLRTRMGSRFSSWTRSSTCGTSSSASCRTMDRSITARSASYGALLLCRGFSLQYLICALSAAVGYSAGRSLK